jgi:hypothetical protein
MCGLLLIFLGFWLRWLLSRRYRERCDVSAAADKLLVHSYSLGGKRIPLRAAVYSVFFPSLLVYQSNGHALVSGDTAPMIQTAMSLLEDGDFALDEWVDPDAPPYYVTNVKGHYYTAFSLGPAFAALPFVQVCNWLGGELDDYDARAELEKVIASIIAAGSCLLMFLVLLRLATPGQAALLTFFFAFCTENWVICSQALWQHGLVALCASAILFIELHHEHRPPWRASVLEGMLLGFAMVCRPTAAILGLAFCLFVAGKRARHLPAVAGGALVVCLPVLHVHLSLYDSILGPYHHAAEASKWGVDYKVSLAGDLLSPARGLLIYEPLVLLVACAPLRSCRGRVHWLLATALMLWFVIHLLVVSQYKHWWGGYCWGPRFIAEVMPALVVLITAPVVRLWRSRIGRVVVVVCMGWSLWLQGVGAYSFRAHRWQAEPVSIDSAPERLWDWKNPPFLYPWRDGS